MAICWRQARINNEANRTFLDLPPGFRLHYRVLPGIVAEITSWGEIHKILSQKWRRRIGVIVDVPLWNNILAKHHATVIVLSGI